MKISDDFAFSLLDDLYAAATSPHGWQRFVGGLQHACPCEGVYLLVDGTANSAGEAEHPTAQAPKLHGSVGDPCFSPTVRWGAAQHGDCHWQSAEDDRLLASACGLALSMRQATASARNEALRLLTFLRPHLERVSCQLAQAKHTGSDNGVTPKHGFGWFAEMFDTPVVHVDASGQVIEMSSTARQALEKGGLQLKGTQLSACRTDENIILREMVLRAAGSTGHPVATGTAAQFSAAVRFSRNENSPLGAVFAGVAAQHGGLPTVLVFLFDHSLPASSRAPLLRKLFQLSPTEVRLVDELLQGHRIKSAAHALRLTENTARFHLKEIFRKIGVNCQVDLLRAVLALPGGVDLMADAVSATSIRNLSKRSTVQAVTLEAAPAKPPLRPHRINLHPGRLSRSGGGGPAPGLLCMQRPAGLGLHLQVQ